MPVFLGRFVAIARKEVMHIWRDQRNLFLVTLAPSFLLLTFAYVFSFDIERFYIAVWDQDQTPLSRRYLSTLLSDETLILKMTVSSYDEIDRVLVAGTVRGVLVIPPGFQETITRREQVTVQAILDGINPNAARQCVGQLQARTAHFTVQEMVSSLTINAEPIDIRSRTQYNPAAKATFSMVPGLIAVVMSMPVFQVAQALTKEKEMGTMEGLISTPIRAAELMLGKLIPYLVTGTVGALLAAALAILWFKVPFRGSMGLFLLLSCDFLFASLSIGAFLSNFLSSQQATQMACFLIFLIPGFFMSGLITPVNQESSSSLLLSFLLPTSHYITICRALFLKGVGLAELYKPALSLFGIGSTMLLGSILTFRKRLA